MSSNRLTWSKSSYSGSEPGECLEFATEWHTSTHSGSAGGDCVEVAACSATVHIRDSKRRAGGSLAVSAAAWRGLLVHLSR
ncbi:DUF397 domain-containing protein [Streptomyces mayteni]